MSTDKKNILLITYGSEGDFAPVLAIGKGLSRRGHHVTVFTNCVHEARAKAAELEFISSGTKADYDELVMDMHTFHIPSSFPEAFRKHYLKKFDVVYKTILDWAGDTGNIVVARGVPGIAERIACEKLNIPLISVYFCPSDFIQLPLMEKLLRNTYEEEINKMRTKIGLSPMTEFLSWLGTSDKQIGLWPGWFDDNLPEWVSRVELPGFAYPHTAEKREIRQEDGKKIENFISGGKPVVLITHASTISEKKGFFDRSIEACLELGCSCIVVSPYEKPEGIYPEEDVLLLKYVPFEEILPSVSALIHHGGINTLALALLYGVPQLLLADTGEREYNGRCLQKMSVGEVLQSTVWKRENIKTQMLKLLYSPELKANCRNYAKRIDPENIVDTVCAMIEAAHGNQSVFRSRPLYIENKEDKDFKAHKVPKNLSPEKHALLMAYLARKPKNIE